MIIEAGKTYRVTELDNCRMVPVIVNQTGKFFVDVHRHNESPNEAFWVGIDHIRPLDFAFQSGMTVEFNGARFTYETGYPDGSCMIKDRNGFSRPELDANLSVWVDDLRESEPAEGEDEAPEVEPLTRMVCVYMGEDERARYFFRESEQDALLAIVREVMALPGSSISICENVPF